MKPAGNSARLAGVYPQDAIAAHPRLDVIDPAQALTLHGLFRARAARSPDKTAYIQYHQAGGAGHWAQTTWRQMAAQVARWRRAVVAEGFERGARAAVCLRNRREWVLYDQACLAAGLVVTPLYAEDRADNIAYIMADTGARLLLVENAGMWRRVAAALSKVTALARVVVVEEAGADSESDPRLMPLARWLEAGATVDEAQTNDAAPDALATIVYTSGTTGKPKGVMLSHANILSNAHAGLKSVPVFPADRFLSFLPLSHMFERTVGYYLPMMAGAAVAFNRSIADLPDDLARHKPTLMIAVPRMFERAHGALTARLERAPAASRWLFERAVEVGWRRFERAQGRAAWHPKVLLWPLLNALVAGKIRRRFGGNLRCVISGGAPLAANISRLFIALGVDILQGYGLTETGPTLTVNTPARNRPPSIGLPFIGTEIRLSPAGELQARGPGVMLGYWRNPAATRACLDAHGWFASGDLARIDEDGFLFITGRIKDIIVTATGEKVPPADMEAALCDEALFEQAMVVGEGRSFLAAVIVLNAKSWRRHAGELGVDPNDHAALASAPVEALVLAKAARRLRDFPGYAAVRRVCLTRRAWSVEDGTLTPTLKIKRAVLHERFAGQIAAIYGDKS